MKQLKIHHPMVYNILQLQIKKKNAVNIRTVTSSSFVLCLYTSPSYMRGGEG